MCHPPLTTGMERIKLLGSVRSKDIVLPKDFEVMNVQQSYILKWLLNHDASLRPTSLELLQSDYLPPPQVEEAELQEMVKHTLGMVSHKMSLITIFGHKHFREKFIKNLIFFKKRFQQPLILVHIWCQILDCEAKLL